MSKLTVLGILFFLLASVGFGWAILNLNSFQTKSKESSKTQPTLPTPLPSPTRNSSSIVQPDGIIVPPVDLESDSVINASLSYTFSGTIVEIKNVPEGLELITDIAERGVPRLIVCITCNQPTTVYFNDKGKFTQANFADLKVEQEVRVLTSYDLKSRQWTTQRINIFIRQQPSPTP